MTVPAVLHSYLLHSISYAEYLQEWMSHLGRPLHGLDKRARRYHYYRKYNWDRAERVANAYRVSNRLRSAIDCVEEPQWWFVFTEDWCADSAFAIPILERAAALNPNISLRYLIRDENLNLIDRHLTNGGRSIPKLVGFGGNGEVLFEWGPRPHGVQAERDAMQQAGVAGPALSKAVVDAFEAGGWQQVDEELATVLQAAEITGCTA